VLTRAQKEEQVADLKERFARASSIYLADFRGLDVQSVNQLRRRIRRDGEGSFEYCVTKNSLLRRAAADSPVAQVAAHFEGPTAIALSYGDPVGLARILSDFARDHDVFRLKGGVVEGRALAPREIAELATLPSLEALRGKLVGLLQAPAARLMRLLLAPGGQLARLLDARSREAQARGEG
jgi:large subunit ribosomal protein L10